MHLILEIWRYILLLWRVIFEHFLRKMWVHDFIHVMKYHGSSSVNSLWPSNTVWWLWSWSALPQLLAYHLFNAKPIPGSMLTYCQLGPQEQTSMKFSTNLRTFHSRKCIWKCRLQTGSHLFRLQCLNGAWYNHIKTQKLEHQSPRKYYSKSYEHQVLFSHY